jgi:hypothetical protein
MAEKERGSYEGVWIPLQRDYDSIEAVQLEISVRLAHDNHSEIASFASFWAMHHACIEIYAVFA